MQTFHIGVDIRGALKRSDKELDGILIDDSGRELSAQEVRAKFRSEMSEGRSIFCGCDNRKEDGSCAGHEQTQGVE